jgi:hypothetical protein
MRYLFFVLIILLTSCSSPIENIGQYLPGKPELTRDEFLKKYFTPEAYNVLRDIEIIDGPCFAPYAAGTSIWSTIASFISFNGVGRKIICHSNMIKNIGIPGLLHEYIHHLDDMTRDGDGDWISVVEFSDAYKRLATETEIIPNTNIVVYKYAYDIQYIEHIANDWFTDLFGIGPMSEHIGWSMKFLFSGRAPDYFKWVFRKVFNDCRIEDK